MKSRKAYFGIIIISVLLIVINTVLVYVDEYYENVIDRISQGKVGIMAAGKELRDNISTAEEMYADFFYNRNHLAENKVKEILQIHLGKLPRYSNVYLYPSQTRSSEKILKELIPSDEQFAKTKLALSNYQDFLEWAIKSIDDLHVDTAKQEGKINWPIVKYLAEKDVDAFVQQEFTNLNKAYFTTSRILHHIAHVMVFMTVISVLFFGSTIIFLMVKLLNPYLENKGKLATVGEHMYNVANMAFWEYDFQKDVYRGGHEFAHFFGAKKDKIEVTREQLIELMEPSERAPFIEKLKSTIKSKLPKASYEIKFIDLEGNKRIMSILSEYEYAQDGSPLRRHGIIQDITTRKNIEQELQLNQGKLEEVLYQLEIGVAEVTPLWEDNAIYDIQFKTVNDAFCRIFKQPEEEIKGKNYTEVFQFFGNSWVRLMSRYLKDNFKTNTSVLYNKYLNKWLKIKVYRESNYRIIAFVEDVTQDHNIRLSLRRSQERMILSEKMARFGYCELDVKNKHLSGNQVAFEIHGLVPSSHLTLIQFLRVVIPEDRPIIEGFFNALKANQQVEGTYRVMINDEIRYINCKLEPVALGKKGERGFGFVHDVTASKQVEIELIHAKDKAEESDRLKSAFLANMSHEIRTPLSAIMGFSSILTKNDFVDEEQKIECQNLIEKNSNALMYLINDVVEMAKIESGEINIHPTSFDLNAFVDDVYNVFTAELLKKGRSTLRLFKQMGEEGEFTIIADSYRLTQVINNLISNAIKFTPKGFIEFGYAVEGAEIVFFVRDSGIGIEEDKKDIIFKMFRQADLEVASEFGGTGLGLAISEKLLHLMEGKIWVESVKGVGSTFFFSIPLVSDYAKISVKNPTKLKLDVSVPDFSNKVILIADDEDFIHVLFRNFLNETGAKIVSAKNGAEAIKLLENGNGVDLVLMDMRMPEMNGEEAVKKIRAERSDLPIIAQTAYAFTGDKERFMAVGCTDYLSKPIKEQELLKILAKHLL